MEWIIELHWLQSMWRLQKTGKQGKITNIRKKKTFERKTVLRTDTKSYKFINEQEKWIKCSRMVHIVLRHHSGQVRIRIFATSLLDDSTVVALKELLI